VPAPAGTPHGGTQRPSLAPGQLRREYEAGQSYRQLAATYGLAASVVRKRLAREGTMMRTAADGARLRWAKVERAPRRPRARRASDERTERRPVSGPDVMVAGVLEPDTLTLAEWRRRHA
jgi:hypothetical protein